MEVVFRRVSAQDLDEAFNRLSQLDFPENIRHITRCLTGSGQVIDQITHGENLSEAIAQLRGILPRGADINFPDDELGEHATRAPGALRVEIDLSGYSLVVKWAGGTKSMLILNADHDVDIFAEPGFCKGSEIDEWQNFSFSTGSPEVGRVKQKRGNQN